MNDCPKPVSARGLCGTHYARWHRHGDPLIVTRDIIQGVSTAERFWLRVNKDGPLHEQAPHLGRCWMWTGNTSYGYGVFVVSKRWIPAHIFAREAIIGNAPEGLELDHVCHTLSDGSCPGGETCLHRACVNPAHLEPVTTAENARRRIQATPRCRKGHLYDEANTRLTRNGHRRCLTCERDNLEARRKSPNRNSRYIKIAVQLGDEDAAVIDAARKDMPRAAWIRDAALAAVTTGLTLPPGRKITGTIGNGKKALVAANEEEAALIDAARGGTPRSTWMRAAALAAAA